MEIPEENILGELNKGVYVLMSGLDLERLVLSAGPVGLMQNAFDIAMDYCQTREQFGQKIGDFQIMQAKMADMYMKLQSSRAFLYSLARNADEGVFCNTVTLFTFFFFNFLFFLFLVNLTDQDCASVFTMVAEHGVSVADEAIQTLGGNGYINEYPTGRILRDAKLYTIGGGTNEIRRWLVGRELMKNFDSKAN